MVSKREPYRHDEDEQYEALEADAGEDNDVRDEADEYSGVDPEAMYAEDEEFEDAYPSAAQTRARTEELDRMLDESVNRDPEALAADQARRHSKSPEGDLSPEGRKLFDRTTEFRQDDFDTEDIKDAD